ncbi:lipopolysaccharide biosynthesis protein RfbH [Paenibacillus sp. GYB004]|uniref:lipopolysaccharide biosynthesis protein RfbH n=1 Tax=Paenibacillus sp. GYB004 TaxID=2994393 RepID=UPI002F964054
MIKTGDLVNIETNNFLGLVLEVMEAHSLVVVLQEIDCSTNENDIRLQIEDKNYIYSESKKQFFSNDVLKHRALLDKKMFEVIIRSEILSKVEDFYNLFHKKDHSSSKGVTNFVPYGGRVYDEKEMMSLVDSSLDFWLTGGRYFKQFEKQFAEYLGVRYALLTNSGSSANLLAFSSLTSPKLGDRRINPGDEVITVAAGFPTTVAPIIQNGAVPVFIDVDLGTYNILAERIEDAVTDKTKAIMIAHTMGNPFNIKEVMRVATKYNLWVIEDNCDALGSKYDGQLTGTFAHIATSSFYPPHHMTMGEGGAVYTNDPQLKMIIESFRDWGRDCWCPSGCDDTCKKRFGWQLGSLPQGYDHKYTYSHIGYNLRVTDMQAAIGVEQIKKVPLFTELRKRNFNQLLKGLEDLSDVFILPYATPNSDPSWFGFILTLRDSVRFTKNEIVSHLESKKIQTRMLFAGNLTRQPAFKDVNFRIHGTLTNTDKILHDTFLVGVYPGLSETDIEFVISEIREFVKNNN